MITLECKFYTNSAVLGRISGDTSCSWKARQQPESGVFSIQAPRPFTAAQSVIRWTEAPPCLISQARKPFHALGKYTADPSGAAVLLLSQPAAAGEIYNVGSLLTWEEVGKMILGLTGSTSILESIPSDRWQGPTFLKEIWDLGWEKAEKEVSSSGSQARDPLPFLRALQ